MTEAHTLLHRALLALLSAQSTDSIVTDIQHHLAVERERTDDKPTSPCCGAPFMSQRAYNKKVCYDCGGEYPWHLKPGQKPLIKATR